MLIIIKTKSIDDKQAFGIFKDKKTADLFIKIHRSMKYGDNYSYDIYELENPLDSLNSISGSIQGIKIALEALLDKIK